jgi:hypothetical protein
MQDMGVMPPFQGDVLDKAALVAYVLSLRGETVDPRDLLPDRQATAQGDGLDPGGLASAARTRSGWGGGGAYECRTRDGRRAGRCNRERRRSSIADPDPLGYPYRPCLLQALSTFTLTLHFLAMNLTVGSVFIFLWLRIARRQYDDVWRGTCGIAAAGHLVPDHVRHPPAALRPGFVWADVSTPRRFCSGFTGFW